MLDSSFSFMFNLGRAKLGFCCFSGDFYAEEGKLAEFSRGIADFLVDLVSSDDSKASPDMAMVALWQFRFKLDEELQLCLQNLVHHPQMLLHLQFRDWKLGGVASVSDHLYSQSESENLQLSKGLNAEYWSGSTEPAEV